MIKMEQIKTGVRKHPLGILMMAENVIVAQELKLKREIMAMGESGWNTYRQVKDHELRAAIFATLYKEILDSLCEIKRAYLETLKTPYKDDQIAKALDALIAEVSPTPLIVTQNTPLGHTES